MPTDECPACGFDQSVTVSSSWTVTLDHTAKSGNAIGSSGRGSKGWKYKNERKAVARVPWNWDNGPPTEAKKKRRVWVTRLWGKHQRAFDIDNMAWGMKPLFDQIKSQGWIVEDSPKWVERIYQQRKSDDDRNHIIVRVEELE